MIARISDVQKLKQKSQSNNREISFGALVIILSLMPSFPISKMTKAEAKVIQIKAAISVIKYIVDIVLWSLK